MIFDLCFWEIKINETFIFHNNFKGSCELLKPCLNGANCTDDPTNGAYFCECATFYSGAQCELGNLSKMIFVFLIRNKIIM
jgi:hypothetical protein